MAAAELATITERIAPCRDPIDDKFRELAKGHADLIMTGDDDLLALNPICTVSGSWKGSVLPRRAASPTAASRRSMRRGHTIAPGGKARPGGYCSPARHRPGERLSSAWQKGAKASDNGDRNADQA